MHTANIKPLISPLIYTSDKRPFREAAIKRSNNASCLFRSKLKCINVLVLIINNSQNRKIVKS